MKSISNKITRNQYMFIIQGSMIGIGILSLSSEVCKDAKQSGWIAVLLGGLYPIYLTLAVSIIYKKLNYIDFVSINKKLYGKILSYVLIPIFIFYFILFEAFVLSGFANVMVFSTTKFLSPYVIIVITAFMAYTSAKGGLTQLGRLSELFFYLTISLLIIPLYFVSKGDVTNLLPVVDDMNSIFKVIPTTFFSYSGVEICILAIPFITDTKKIRFSGLWGSLITIILYTFTTLIIISYCGWKLTSKLQYPFLYLVSGSTIPVISNFEPLFIFLWGFKAIQTISIGAFGASYALSSITKTDLNRCCILCSTAVVILAVFLIPEYNRSEAIETILPYFIVFILLWTTLTLLLASFKRGEKG